MTRRQLGLAYIRNGPPIGLQVLIIFRNKRRTRSGEIDNPPHLTFAGELSCLLKDIFVFIVLRNSSYETLWFVLRNVFPHEFNPRGNAFRDRFFAQDVFSSGERLEYYLRLFRDRKNDDNGSTSGLASSASNELCGSASWWMEWFSAFGPRVDFANAAGPLERFSD